MDSKIDDDNRRMSLIKFAFFDIDGVLTDGMVYVNSEGDESKRISFDDIDAIFELKRAGIKVGFISGEDNKFTEYVRKRFSPDYFMSGCKDKLKGFNELVEKENIDEAMTCFVGDSKKDIELLKYLRYSFSPSDVSDEIRQSAKFVTESRRGNGVIMEVAKFVLGQME